MSYVLGALSPDEATVRVLDTRGRFQHAWLSILPLLRTCLSLVVLKLTGRVDVVHVNISAHGSSVRKPVALWTCRMLRLPVLLHLHASSYQEFFAPLPSSAKRLLRKTFQTADRVIVLGAVWRDYVHDQLGVIPERIRILPYAVPGPATTPQRPRATNAPLNLLLLGRLGKRKGVPELLAALASPQLRGEPWAATLAGDGDVQYYAAEATALGISERLAFPGWVGQEAARRLLSDSDILLLPSHAEGLPVAVIEALAYGVPVVTTPVGAISEVVSDGVNGLLVPPGDSAALARAIRSLLHDEALRLKLARGARATWETNHTMASYVESLVTAWRELATASASEPLPEAA